MVAIERLRRSKPLRLARGLLATRAGAAQARRHVERLPLYQIALWPDGWELTGEGALLVRDTHEMAEARRWYAMAAQNGALEPGQLSSTSSRTMRLYGIGVPSALLALAGRRFASEQAASVAIRLVASDWLEQRRQMLARDPARMLALQSRTWCGSRHGSLIEPSELRRLLPRLLDLCVAEGLAPALALQADPVAHARRGAETAVGHDRFTEVRVDDGYGLTTWHCRIWVNLDQRSPESIAEVLELALIPWNRAVLRDGRPWRLLQVEVATECVIR